MDEISRNDIEEFRNILQDESKNISKVVKIIYDGRQYSIRIPVKMAKSMKLDPDTDKIMFTFRGPGKDKEEPELDIRLVKGHGIQQDREGNIKEHASDQQAIDRKRDIELVRLQLDDSEKASF
jgi:hypothetical protein